MSNNYVWPLETPLPGHGFDLCAGPAVIGTGPDYSARWAVWVASAGLRIGKWAGEVMDDQLGQVNPLFDPGIRPAHVSMCFDDDANPVIAIQDGSNVVVRKMVSGVPTEFSWPGKTPLAFNNRAVFGSDLYILYLNDTGDQIFMRLSNSDFDTEISINQGLHTTLSELMKVDVMTIAGNYYVAMWALNTDGQPCYFRTQAITPILWTPATVGPLHWYDASAIVGLSDGDFVQNWPDIGSGGNDFGRNTDPTSPSYVVNGLNGLAIVDFSGFCDHLTMQVNGATPGTDTPLDPAWDGLSQVHVFIVTKALTSHAPTSIFSVNLNTLIINSSGQFGDAGKYNMIGRRTGSGGLTTLGSGVAPTAGFDIVHTKVNYASALAGMRINGTAAFVNSAFSTAGVTTGSITVRIPDINNGTEGQFAEIIVDTNDIDDATVAKYEGYLAWKWGLQGNLPVGHPYKSAAPTL